MATEGKRIAQKLIERVVRDAVSSAITRSGLEWDEDLEQSEEDVIQDAINVCTGVDMGCLPEDEATPDNCTHLFVAALIDRELEAERKAVDELLKAAEACAYDWASVAAVHAAAARLRKMRAGGDPGNDDTRTKP